MENTCKDHESHVVRIKRLEDETSEQWRKLESINTKLNLILGGIIISPFIVTVITLLINAGKLTKG